MLKLLFLLGPNVAAPRKVAFLEGAMVHACHNNRFTILTSTKHTCFVYSHQMQCSSIYMDSLKDAEEKSVISMWNGGLMGIWILLILEWKEMRMVGLLWALLLLVLSQGQAMLAVQYYCS